MFRILEFMTFRQILGRTLAAVAAMFLAVPAMVGADVIINSVTFPDENFRNWILEQDYGSDGVLTEQEIASVTFIDVHEKGITYLVGIEYFTSLQKLNCSTNNLKTLNLRKNTQLTNLDCSYNYIEHLDLTPLGQLGILYAMGNLLTGIQLNEYVPLTKIEVDQNSIRGESMDALIAQLPEVSNKYFVVVKKGDYQEQNILTKVQASAARAKGWDVKIRSNVNHSVISTYNGQDPAFYAIKTEVLSPHGFSSCPVNTSPPYELVEFSVMTSEGYQPIISITSGSGEGSSIEFASVNDEAYTFRMPLDDVTISTDFGWIINEPHFPDKNFRDFLQNEYFGADVLLTDAEIASTTHMDVDELSISTLAGIEKFSALQFLSCDLNSLNALDVSALQQLQTLICSHNNLTALDLTNNHSLTFLDCSCNQIVGENMEQLVGSLPTVEEGVLHILSLKDNAEHNEITTEQVEVAKGKGWKVYAQTDEGWQDFDEVVTGIDNIKSSHPADASKYNLQGQVVGNDYKGIVIEDGRRIVVR